MIRRLVFDIATCGSYSTTDIKLKEKGLKGESTKDSTRPLVRSFM